MDRTRYRRGDEQDPFVGIGNHQGFDAMVFLLAAVMSALRLVLLRPNTRHFDTIDEHALGLLQELPHGLGVRQGVTRQQAELDQAPLDHREQRLDVVMGMAGAELEEET